MIAPRILRPFETAFLAGLFVATFRVPGALGGALEVLLGVLFPLLLLEPVFRGRSPFWTWLALALGLGGLYLWVPATLASKGGLPFPLAVGATLLLCAWEALGLLLVALAAREARRRGGALAAGFAAALALLLWERFGFHVYPWTWGSVFGAVPWLARSAAFLGAYGLSALVWGVGAATAAALVEEARGWRLWAGPSALAATLLLGGLAWPLLPREDWRQVDLALIQPNWEPGVRQVGMEAELWHRTDALLAAHHLPRPDRPTLVLWPESAILGINHLRPDARLAGEAQRRGVAWLFGTEGGAPGGLYLTYNLVRGEVGGRPSFMQAKTEPMPFGERIPGPAWLRTRLEQALGFVSQEPGSLGPQSFFAVPTAQGDLRVHPLICSEALLPFRAREGRELAQADLLTNHTNDGWFDRTVATDLHGVQIRLRAVELGVPLVRVTSTGKSGLYREDGSGGLWGEPMTAATYVEALAWQPVRTPARSAWVYRLLAGGALLALALRLAFRRPAP